MMRKLFLILILLVRCISLPAQEPRLVLPVGHSDYINSTVFSSDSRWLLTASKDNTARLWDVNSGMEVQTFTGHLKPINDASFSADNRYVLTASLDGTARIWDVYSGKELHRFTHSWQVESALLPANGTEVVVYGAGGLIDIWNIEKETLRTTLDTRSFHVDRVAMSEDGHWLAAATNEGIEIWNFASGRSVKKYRKRQGVAFSRSLLSVPTGALCTPPVPTRNCVCGM